MKLTNAIATAALLMTWTSTATSQNTSSPPGYINTEGNSNYTDLFSRSSVRFQQIDNLYKTAGLIKNLGVRFDGSRTYNHTTPARSWSNVRIFMAPGRFATASSTFAANYAATPTQCFSGTVAFPATSGRSNMTPAPWTTGMNIPFLTNFIFNPTAGQLLTEIRTIGNSSTATMAVDANAWRKDFMVYVGPGCEPVPGKAMTLSSCIDDVGSRWEWKIDVNEAPGGAPTWGKIASTNYPSPGPLPCPCPKPPGVSIWLYPKSPGITLFLGVADPKGSISRTFPVTPNPALSGASVAFQAASPHPFAFGMSLSSFGRQSIAVSKATIHSKVVFAPSSSSSSGVLSNLGVIFRL